ASSDSLMSFCTQSPMESSAACPSNSPPTAPSMPRWHFITIKQALTQLDQSSHSTFKLPKPKQLWKSAHRAIPLRGRRKLAPRDTAMDISYMEYTLMQHRFLS